MAALQDSGSKDPAAKRAGMGGGGEPKQKRARSVGADAASGGGSSAPATAPPAPESRAHPVSAAASLVDVSVEDADALDGVACYPQCDVGHAVCSPCHDKLQATGKCAVCGVITSRYRRCHVMERLVESIRVQCLYAAHGCALRPVYYDQESHRSVCVHAPCHCPGEACSFVGSTAALLDHFSMVHRWPCHTTVKADDKGFFAVCLRDGFNLLVADLYTGNSSQGATANTQCLLLLTVAPQPYACIISVHCIDPHATATATASGSQALRSKEMQCVLRYSKAHTNSKRGLSQLKIDHFQYLNSSFRVICTDLSNGLPKPDDCFQFVVPNQVIGDPKKDGIQVYVCIFIE